MIRINSSLWRLRSYDNIAVYIGVSRSALPDDLTLAITSETAFNTICREAFHDSPILPIVHLAKNQ